MTIEELNRIREKYPSVVAPNESGKYKNKFIYLDVEIFYYFVYESSEVFTLYFDDTISAYPVHTLEEFEMVAQFFYDSLFPF